MSFTMKHEAKWIVLKYKEIKPALLLIFIDTVYFLSNSLDKLKI